jgi:hypothetical protein
MGKCADFSMAGLERIASNSLSSPLLLDIAGRTALPYKIRKIDSDVFVACAVLKDQGLNCSMSRYVLYNPFNMCHISWVSVYSFALELTSFMSAFMYLGT